MVGLVEVEMNKVEFQSQIISDCNDETDEDSSLSSYICNFYEFYASVGAISLSFTTAPFREKVREKLRGSGGRSARERPCRRRSPFFLQIKSSVVVSSSLPPIFVCRSSSQPSTAVVMVLESRRVCGKDGAVKLYVFGFRETEALTDPSPPVFASVAGKLP
ncbi:hypothetical protein F2Q69_00037161 [Brassica cretica]|uniref:Uncharacterized protein n=1 Tax=Brassica cretica TaxID=69181 RepID=A0A8S9SC43_BRACR|nr:hypothetical protein F2Q69_00037161 [Brassica cretica]